MQGDYEYSPEMPGNTMPDPEFEKLLDEEEAIARYAQEDLADAERTETRVKTVRSQNDLAYHEKVLLDFFVYILTMDQRRQLMELHPVSYRIVVSKARIHRIFAEKRT